MKEKCKKVVQAAWRTACLLALACVALVLIDSAILPGEVQRNHFTDYEALKRSELIEKGWVPDFLPPSSRDISVVHNIDTSARAITFTLDGAALDGLRKKLEQAGWVWHAGDNSYTGKVEDSAYKMRIESAAMPVIHLEGVRTYIADEHRRN